MRPISEWKIGQHPDLIWVETVDRGAGVACHYDCQWMRDDPAFDDCDDAFTWHDDRDFGNHIEFTEITGWRLPTEQELSESEEG